MTEDILNMFQGIGGILGFSSAEIGWAYIGCILASLLCVIYGLIQWNREGKVTRIRRSKRGGWMKKDKRPQRMR
jgi:hypothetical protein